MRKLKVVCTAYLIVPNHWKVVSHPDGFKVLKIGKDYLDFSLTCLKAVNADLSEWQENIADVQKVIARITQLDTEIEVLD